MDGANPHLFTNPSFLRHCQETYPESLLRSLVLANQRVVDVLNGQSVSRLYLKPQQPDHNIHILPVCWTRLHFGSGTSDSCRYDVVVETARSGPLMINGMLKDKRLDSLDPESGMVLVGAFNQKLREFYSKVCYERSLALKPLVDD